MPFVRPVTKLAATVGATAEIPGLLDEAWDAARRPHSGPAFLDFPLDHVFMEAPAPEPSDPEPIRASPVDEGALARAGALLRDAERPVVMAGNGLYWAHGEHALRHVSRVAAVQVVFHALYCALEPAFIVRL